MPLENGSWRETTAEDLQAFQRGLEGVEEVPLSAELEARIEAALAQRTANGPSLAMLIEGNRRLYPQMARLLTKPAGVVDIIVPVYNAWHITRRCLEAVYARTDWPHEVIVVDDASDEFTTDALERFEHPGDITVLRNAKNRGFAATVNRGIRVGNGEYVCLLNSDVLVTPGWLTKMILALEADERTAIVCPATNNTAVVDVPMSPGASYLQMNLALEVFATRRYPEIMPTGFCFLFRRSLLAELGYFDEAYTFAGEETAFWWKAVQKGYRAVMADDTYVYHQRAVSSSALGAEKDASLRRAASARFNQLHPEWVEWRDAHNVRGALGPLREPVPPTLLRAPTDRYRICWLVHDARASGAMRYIADLVNELCERGVNAKVVVLKREGTPAEWVGELRSAPVFFASQDDLLAEFPQRVFPGGLVIASTVELAPAVQALVEGSGGRLRGCLHAQSFDPALALAEEDKAHLRALYKLVPDVIASSRWVGEEIAALGSNVFATIHPGVDRTLFYPRDRSAGDERPTVMIPMNSSVWWRGWDRGLELIRELEKQAEARGLDLRILVYGVDSLPIVSRAICLGVISQARLAALLGSEVDALVDPSHLHSYGMPCLEAKASGVYAFAGGNRGVGEYWDDTSINVLDLEKGGALTILDKLQGYKVDLFEGEPDYLAEKHDRDKSVAAWIEAVESHFKLLRRKLRICVVAPHLRKWGGPTTMLMIAHELARRGHRVEVATVYEDVAPSIQAIAEVPILKGQLPEGADLYITNSDNPWVAEISALPAKRILLKLSHNPRFKREEEKGLQQPWDAVVTSTQWLADVCATPTEGWDYPPVQAEVIGWWHYEHARFRCPPSERTYGDGTAERPFVIGTLVHAHPTKGTQEALELLSKLPSEFRYRLIGVGEVPPRAVRLPEGMEYLYNPARDQMAALMKSCDVWVSASQSEGLGRMSLEVMSAGCAIVARRTGSEHLAGAVDVDALAIANLLRDDKWRAERQRLGFEVAERAADPEPCINALEEVLANVVG